MGITPQAETLLVINPGLGRGPSAAGLINVFADMEYKLLPTHTGVYISKFTKATRDAVNIGFYDIGAENYLDGNNIRSLTCTINYPLSKECAFQITLPEKKQHFFLSDIILAICDKYREIYAEEDATSSIKEARMPGWLNRNDTGGKWGIGIHFLDELQLSGLTLDTSNNTIVVDVDTDISPSHLIPFKTLDAEQKAEGCKHPYYMGSSCSDGECCIWTL